MIAIEIPGWGNLEIEYIVFDLNGTLARDGKIPPEVKDRIETLSTKVKLYVLTADTQGTAEEESQVLPITCIRVSKEDTQHAKMEFLRTLRPEATVAMGNGNNDQLVLGEAGLGIAVMESEGLAVAAMKSADIVVKNISDALDLLLKPKRLIATLRE